MTLQGKIMFLWRRIADNLKKAGVYLAWHQYAAFDLQDFWRSMDGRTMGGRFLE
jgi:hypothetical protein